MKINITSIMTVLFILSMILSQKICGQDNISVQSQPQKVLLEDFNDGSPAPGFISYSGLGSVGRNETDNETWTIRSGNGAYSGWNDFTSSAIWSPVFRANYFRLFFSVRNIQRNSQSDWDNIVVRIFGLEKNLDIYFGTSSDDGQLKPDRALYVEIQHPDKSNGYIWDSAVNNNGQEVPSPWREYIDSFPERIYFQIHFSGPGLPLNISYNFDNGLKYTHLLQWNASPRSHSFDNVLAKDTTDTYQVAIHANGGSNPPFSFDIDYLKVLGDIQSEFAINNPDTSHIQNWQIFE
ncbi:MAG: hypothetical protein ACOX5R_12045 [bacterium]|jgi:hypothetical protein